MASLTEAQRASWRQMMLMAFQLSGELGRQLATATGLSYQDYLVLAVLQARDDGRARAFELGDELGWEKSRVSHHVARMAQRGHVRREPVATDGRGAYIRITTKGRTALAAAAPAHDAVVRRHFLANVDRDELEVIGDVAGRVLASLGTSAAR